MSGLSKYSNKFEPAISSRGETDANLLAVNNNYTCIFTCHGRKRDADSYVRVFGVDLLEFLPESSSLSFSAPFPTSHLQINLRKIVSMKEDPLRENHFTPQEPQDESGPTSVPALVDCDLRRFVNCILPPRQSSTRNSRSSGEPLRKFFLGPAFFVSLGPVFFFHVVTML